MWKRKIAKGMIGIVADLKTSKGKTEAMKEILVRNLGKLRSWKLEEETPEMKEYAKAETMVDHVISQLHRLGNGMSFHFFELPQGEASWLSDDPGSTGQKFMLRGILQELELPGPAEYYHARQQINGIRKKADS
jgi:hypothetical protein